MPLRSLQKGTIFGAFADKVLSLTALAGVDPEGPRVSVALLHENGVSGIEFPEAHLGVPVKLEVGHLYSFFVRTHQNPVSWKSRLSIMPIIR